jgi:hypothetical protein
VAFGGEPRGDGAKGEAERTKLAGALDRESCAWRARIRPCSYCAAPSITVRMNASAGESPLPSPLALTTRAPAPAPQLAGREW